MGTVVAAIATTHNPRIFWNRDAADAASRDAVHAVFEALRRRLAEARPDRLIVIGDDHLDTFFLDHVSPFCIGLAPRARGPMWYEAEIMQVPRYEAAVDVALAAHLLEAGIRANIDLAQAREFDLDHAFCVPLAILRPEADLPIVPVFTNLFVSPLPSPRRFYEVGALIHRAVRERPDDARVAVIASFNLSLDVGGPRMGQRDEAFDRTALELMRAGRVDDLLSRFTVERLYAAGNSTVEFLNYDVLLGVVGTRPPDLLEFHQVPAWGACPFAAWSLS